MRDVVIVGGGPAGLFTAYQLVELGFDVSLFEDHSDVGDYVVCTGIIGGEAFERYDLPEETILDEICAIKAFSPLGSTLAFRSSSPLAYIVSKKEFNRKLAKQAQAKGVDMRFRSRVVDINVEHDAVRAKVKSETDGEYVIRAKMIVIATGINYALNKKLGLGLPKELLRGAQAEINFSRGEWTEVYFGRSISPGAFAWVVPYRNRSARIGLMTSGHPRLHFQNFLKEAFPAWRQADVKVSYKSIAQGLVSPSFAERVIAVGEAAGQVKTTTGGGIYYGLLGSEMAVDVIAKAFQTDQFDAAFLAKYEQTWRKEIGRELLIGYYARKLLSNLSDNKVERLFRVVRMDGILDLVNREAKFDWHQALIVELLKHRLVNRMLWSN